MCCSEGQQEYTHKPDLPDGLLHTNMQSGTESHCTPGRKSTNSNPGHFVAPPSDFAVDPLRNFGDSLRSPAISIFPAWRERRGSSLRQPGVAIFPGFRYLAPNHYRGGG